MAAGDGTGERSSAAGIKVVRAAVPLQRLRLPGHGRARLGYRVGYGQRDLGGKLSPRLRISGLTEYDPNEIM